MPYLSESYLILWKTPPSPPQDKAIDEPVILLWPIQSVALAWLGLDLSGATWASLKYSLLVARGGGLQNKKITGKIRSSNQ